MPRPKSPGVTADTIIMNQKGSILLIKRKNPPFKGFWALPGGFIDYGRETIEECAVRETLEETGLSVKLAALLCVRSKPARDPRGHTVTAVYVTEPIGNEEVGSARAGDDACDVLWFEPSRENLEKTPLAFDHKQIIEEALERGFSGSRP